MEYKNRQTLPEETRKESIYGSHLPALEEDMRRLESAIGQIRQKLKKELGMDPIEHCLARIKTDESMREKCRRSNLPETPESALFVIHDAIGLRIVCAFVDDIYAIRDALRALPGVRVETEKDYIRHAKPNGYRSYHMILRLPDGYYAEIQLRTISMDTWAALEHHLKYKHDVGPQKELIIQELKRCADELASTDLSMQTIRDMIRAIPAVSDPRKESL
jgi:putative GTP pyrophosphokinase